jgi:hypothetical protein
MNWQERRIDLYKEIEAQGQLCQVDSFLGWRPASQFVTHPRISRYAGQCDLSDTISGLSL